jgi:pimeloyl-ACP methyl ester carboxylesterase
MGHMIGYLEAETLTAEGANGVSYAYRRPGPASGRPLVLLQHFRGNLENDLLGFSIGSFVAQEIALTRAALVGKMVLASTAPQGAPGMHGWAPDIIQAIGQPVTDAEGFLHGFFTDSAASRAAGAQFLGRSHSRTQGRDKDTTWQTRNAQYDAVLKWGTPNYSLLQRLNAIRQPVFVANGDDDRMILPWYSHLVASLLPDAFVKLYPDAAHGFLFQHAEEFAGDVLKFL